MPRRVVSPGGFPTAARGDDKKEGPLPGPREGLGSGPESAFRVVGAA